jgi:hypothetical protein
MEHHFAGTNISVSGSSGSAALISAHKNFPAQEAIISFALIIVITDFSVDIKVSYMAVGLNVSEINFKLFQIHLEVAVRFCAKFKNIN